MANTRSPALLLLEKLQETAYQRLGLLEEVRSGRYAEIQQEVTDQTVERVLDAIGGHSSSQAVDIERLRADLEQAQAEVPTRFEDPMRYALLCKLAEATEAAALKLGRPIPVSPRLGSLPAGKVNAQAMYIPTSHEYLVLFEAELFTFALLLSKAVAAAIPGIETRESLPAFVLPEAVAATLDQNPMVARRFQEVLAAYLCEGRPSAAPQYYLGEPWSYQAFVMCRSLEMFVMGHEYGHITSGHIDGSATEAHLQRHNWEAEFEADARGIELAMLALRAQGLDIARSYLGADLFFSCIRVIENSLSVMRTGEIAPADLSTDTHPPPLMRRDRLRAHLRRALSGENTEHAETAIRLGESVEHVIDQLWERALPLLHHLRDQNVPLAPLWDDSRLDGADPS